VPPMLPPAPGLLSTVTGWPKFFDNSSAIALDAISTAPPGGKGQTSRMALFGKACANAAGADSKALAMPTDKAKVETHENDGRNLKHAI